MARCAPQQLQNISSSASVRCLSYGSTIAPAHVQGSSSARRQHAAAAGPPLCLCHLFRAPCDPVQTAGSFKGPGLLSPGEWPFCARGCRRAASTKAAIPRRATDCGTVSRDQDSAAAVPLMPSLPHSTTIQLGSAPSFVLAPAKNPTNAAAVATPQRLPTQMESNSPAVIQEWRQLQPQVTDGGLKGRGNLGIPTRAGTPATARAPASAPAAPAPAVTLEVEAALPTQIPADPSAVLAATEPIVCASGAVATDRLLASFPAAVTSSIRPASPFQHSTGNPQTYSQHRQHPRWPSALSAPGLGQRPWTASAAASAAKELPLPSPPASRPIGHELAAGCQVVADAPFRLGTGTGMGPPGELSSSIRQAAGQHETGGILQVQQRFWVAGSSLTGPNLGMTGRPEREPPVELLRSGSSSFSRSGSDGCGWSRGLERPFATRRPVAHSGRMAADALPASSRGTTGQVRSQRVRQRPGICSFSAGGSSAAQGQLQQSFKRQATRGYRLHRFRRIQRAPQTMVAGPGVIVPKATAAAHGPMSVAPAGPHLEDKARLNDGLSGSALGMCLKRQVGDGPCTPSGSTLGHAGHGDVSAGTNTPRRLYQAAVSAKSDRDFGNTRHRWRRRNGELQAWTQRQHQHHQEQQKQERGGQEPQPGGQQAAVEDGFSGSVRDECSPVARGSFAGTGGAAVPVPMAATSAAVSVTAVSVAGAAVAVTSVTPSTSVEGTAADVRSVYDARELRDHRARVNGDKGIAGQEEEDSSQPSTSYDSHLMPLGLPPLQGWRRRRLVRLFPVPRPHRRKRRALLRGWAPVAAGTIATVATATAAAPAGAGVTCKGDRVGVRRTRERFNFPFTVSRTSDVPIAFGQASMRTLLHKPPPATSLSTLPPLLQAQLWESQKNQLLMEEDGLPWVGAPCVGPAGTGMLALKEQEWLSIPTVEGCCTAAESRQTPGMLLAPEPVAVSDPLSVSMPSSSLLGSQHTTASSAAASDPSPSPLPVVHPEGPAIPVNSYSLRTTPVFVLFAEAIPDHQFVVYRHRPTGQWVWQPLLRVTPASCMGKGLLAVAIQATALPTVPVAAHVRPPEAGQATDSVGNRKGVESTVSYAAGVVPLEFYLVRQPPVGVPHADEGSGCNHMAFGETEVPVPQDPAVLPSTVSPSSAGRMGLGVTSARDGVSIVDKATKTDCKSTCGGDDGSGNGKPKSLSPSVASAALAAVATGTDEGALCSPPVPTLVLNTPGHYLVISPTTQRFGSPTHGLPRGASTDSHGGEHSDGGVGDISRTSTRGNRGSGRLQSAARRGGRLRGVASTAVGYTEAAAVSRHAVHLPAAAAVQATVGSTAAAATPVLTPLTPLCPPPPPKGIASEAPSRQPQLPPSLPPQRSAIARAHEGGRPDGAAGGPVPASAPAPGTMSKAMLPRAQAILRYDLALVLDGSSLMGWRGRDWEKGAMELRGLWEGSQRVRPGLLVLATSRTMKSLQQEWLDKQAFLPEPDVLLLALGTQVAYRIPAAAATATAAAVGARPHRRPSGGLRSVRLAANWQLDEQWSEMLDSTFDATAVRRAVDAVVRQYAIVRVVLSSPSCPQSPNALSAFPADASLQPQRSPTVDSATTTAAGAIAVAVDAQTGVSTGTEARQPHRHCTASSAGRPAVSYGLDKLQSQYMIRLEVYGSLVHQVIHDIRDHLASHSPLMAKPPAGQRDMMQAAAGTMTNTVGGANGGGTGGSSSSSSSSSTMADAKAGPCSAVRFEVQPRGPRGEWCTLYVLPSAAGKAAAMRHVMRRFVIDTTAVVAAGDSDRDAELLAAAGAAIITATRPSSMLRQLLLADGSTASCTKTPTSMPPPQPPPSVHSPKMPASTGCDGANVIGLGLGADGGADDGGTTSSSSSSSVDDGFLGGDGTSGGGADYGGGSTVVVQSRKGPQGVVEGLRLLGLL